MLRLAGERQTLTGDDESEPGLVKTTDPLLSIIELAAQPRGGRRRGGQPWPAARQLDAGVLLRGADAGDGRSARGRRLGRMVFRENDVQRAARGAAGHRSLRAARQSRRGAVRGALPSRVSRPRSWASGRARAVIDGFVAGLLVTRREATDVIDVRYIAEDPRTAQRIVNSTVHAFQALNVQWARERSRRRREFLAEQLSQTDSMLARAQAELGLLPEPAAARELARRPRGAADRAARSSTPADRASSTPTGAPSAPCWGGSRPATRPRAPRRSARWPPPPRSATTPRSAGFTSSS